MSSVEINLTEDIIANSLWRWREKCGHLTACSRSSFHYYESDLLSVKSMLTYDHEIKLSRADYLNEFTKATKKFKHAKILDCFKTGRWNKYAPAFYIFVTPKGLLRKGDPIPTYAGIVEFEFVPRFGYLTDDAPTGDKLVFTVRRAPKQIHKIKIEPIALARICRALSFRLFNARAKLNGGYY